MAKTITMKIGELNDISDTTDQSLATPRKGVVFALLQLSENVQRKIVVGQSIRTTLETKRRYLDHKRRYGPIVLFL